MGKTGGGTKHEDREALLGGVGFPAISSSLHFFSLKKNQFSFIFIFTVKVLFFFFFLHNLEGGSTWV